MSPLGSSTIRIGKPMSAWPSGKMEVCLTLRGSIWRREHRVFFIDELLDQLQHQDFQGTVRILGDSDISATTLRTRRGAAESSIALATMQAFENPRQ